MTALLQLVVVFTVAYLFSKGLAQQVYLSLGSTTITTNNTEVLIIDIGEDAPGGLPTLTCHTDLTTCCRNSDNNFMGSLGGEWYYPDGRMVPNAAAGEGFYRVRNAPQVARLARRTGGYGVTYTLSPTGTFCCVIPTTGGEMTFCVYITSITVCPLLPSLTNGRISYSDPTLGVGSVATHSCDTGYTLRGTTNSRTCQSNGTWTESIQSCIVVACPSLPLLTNGRISYSDPTLSVGSVATHSCNLQYTLNGGSTRTCQSDGTWTGSTHMCVVTDCGPLANPSNGYVSLTSGSTTFNSLAMYSCNQCSRIVGTSTRICVASGQWIPEAPSCQIMDCGQPPVISNGYVQTVPSTECNSSAIYTCNRGFELIGERTRTCQTSGRWSDESQVCRTINCGRLSNPSNGQVDTSAGITFGSVASYSCDTGYTLTGSSSRTCSDNGQWTPSEPRCNRVDCGRLSHPSNGRVVTRSGTTFMRVAVYTCYNGYNIRGTSHRTCGANGVWFPNAPACIIVDCGPLARPLNGQVNTNSGTTFNSVATYSCDEGYMINGTNRRVCLANGEWSMSTAFCVPVNCGALNAPINGRVDTPQGTTFTNTATYSCDPGYNLTGCAAAECLSSGSWSCNTPFCADNAMIQLKFGPTSHCVVWSNWKVNLMYMKMQSSVFKATLSGGQVIPKENIQEGYFSCYRSTTETTYRTTITGTERVSAADYARLIQQWVGSGVTTRVQWYVIKIDKNCPVSIRSMDEEECV